MASRPFIEKLEMEKTLAAIKKARRISTKLSLKVDSATWMSRNSRDIEKLSIFKSGRHLPIQSNPKDETLQHSNIQIRVVPSINHIQIPNWVMNIETNSEKAYTQNKSQKSRQTSFPKIGPSPPLPRSKKQIKFQNPHPDPDAVREANKTLSASDNYFSCRDPARMVMQNIVCFWECLGCFDGFRGVIQTPNSELHLVGFWKFGRKGKFSMQLLRLRTRESALNSLHPALVGKVILVLTSGVFDVSWRTRLVHLFEGSGWIWRFGRELC